ncbi:MAG: alpha/beta hydrolase [Enterococcus casseliflavus]|nr:alpha/beta hydrolase [Enterococcus casseliflavus]
MEVEKCYAPLPDGSVLYYEKTGSGRPLFLLHGNGGSSAYFSKQVDALRQKHQLYLIDSRGHGKSTNTQKKIDFFKMATDLLAIIQQEKLTKIALLGFSDGANLAMVFCHLYPEHVSCMILNSGNTEPRGVRLISRIGSVLQYLIVWLCSPFSKGMRGFLPILGLLFRPIGLSTADLNHLSVPTLILVGKRDSIKLSHSFYIANSIPQSNFIVVKGQGHSFARKNPEVFNTKVLSFLEKVGE